MSQTEICDIVTFLFEDLFSKMFLFSIFCDIFVLNFLRFPFSILYFDFQISDSQISFIFSDFEMFFSGYILKFSIFFYRIWTKWSIILFYTFVLNFECVSDFFAEIFHFYCWFCDGHTDIQHTPKKATLNPHYMKNLVNWHLIHYEYTHTSPFFRTLPC